MKMENEVRAKDYVSFFMKENGRWVSKNYSDYPTVPFLGVSTFVEKFKNYIAKKGK